MSLLNLAHAFSKKFLFIVFCVVSINALADSTYPLKPLDYSSPRATLHTFLTKGDTVLQFITGEHWDKPDHKSSEQLKQMLVELESAFDLS